MTCREKWELDHPKGKFDPNITCPWQYKYLGSPDYCGELNTPRRCERCWEREIPEETNKEITMSTKKTKAELMDEIAELKKQVNELEKYETYRQYGDDLKAIHTGFVNSGFSNEQAFHLLQTMLQTSAMNSAIDTIKAVTGRR